MTGPTTTITLGDGGHDGITREDATAIIAQLQAWLETTTPWLPYSLRTNAASIGGVECVGEHCTARTSSPGLDGWWWRVLPKPQRAPTPRGKRTEILCHACAVRAGVTHD